MLLADFGEPWGVKGTSKFERNSLRGEFCGGRNKRRVFLMCDFHTSGAETTAGGKSDKKLIVFITMYLDSSEISFFMYRHFGIFEKFMCSIL